MSRWQCEPLGDLVSFVGGGTPNRSNPAFYGGALPWVTPKDMKTFDISNAQMHLTPAGLAQSASRLVPAGAVLIVVRSGVLKHTLPVAITSIPVALNQDMKALLCGPQLEPRFLARYLQHRSPSVLSWVRATTADNIPVEQLRQLPTPVPSLEEQRRIATILDRADSLRAKRRAAVAQLDNLVPSTFLDLFGDPVTNPRGWREGTNLGDAADVISGITVGRRTTSTTLRRVPYLAVRNVHDMSLDLSVVKTIEATEDEVRRYRLRPGDLLLTEGGDPDKLGRGTLWAGEIDDCIHQNHIFRVRITTEELEPLFLSWLVGSRRGKAYFARSAKQTTGIASINHTQLRGFPLLIPPLEIQREFARRLAKIESLRASYRDSLAGLDELFTSLQRRAFNGGL